MGLVRGYGTLRSKTMPIGAELWLRIWYPLLFGQCARGCRPTTPWPHTMDSLTMLVGRSVTANQVAFCRISLPCGQRRKVCFGARSKQYVGCGEKLLEFPCSLALGRFRRLSDLGRRANASNRLYLGPQCSVHGFFCSAVVCTGWYSPQLLHVVGRIQSWEIRGGWYNEHVRR
jgi:hypothetical protein